ncbi:hypothetical protein PInf_019751 [Phytophthora infestans]|nr:hypothetical protein PInf_019751 [Phytophthora infestans]
MARGGTELESAAEDSISQGFKNWVDVLTEEQVSGLVQQIWKDRQALRRVSLAPAEDVHIEDTPEVPEEPPVRWKDEATDTNELNASPTKLSEKAVQTFDEIKQEEPQSTPEQEKPIDFPEESHENMQDSNSSHESVSNSIEEQAQETQNQDVESSPTAELSEESEENQSLRISIESGELPALLKVHATFRRQLVAQSTSSSFESGEFEDGYIPDK